MVVSTWTDVTCVGNAIRIGVLIEGIRAVVARVGDAVSIRILGVVPSRTLVASVGNAVEIVVTPSFDLFRPIWPKGLLEACLAGSYRSTEAALSRANPAEVCPLVPVAR